MVCADLHRALDLLRGLGMRLDVIYPADAPHTALLSGAGRTVWLTTSGGAA